MKPLKDLFRSGKAQALIEYLLLTMAIVLAVIVFAVNPTAPAKGAFNMILQDPIYMIHAGTNQIQLN